MPIPSFLGHISTMGPTHFHAKRETMCPPPLKINKDSHLIKKLPSSSSSSSSPSSSSSSSTSLSVDVVPGSVKPSQRHPVIIYTHSPKIIHTHPRDFMALVQKLTGQSHSDEDHIGSMSKPQQASENKKLKVRGAKGDDESSSGMTEEECYGLGNDGVVNPCMVQQMFEPPINYINNIPMFTSSATDFLCSNQMYYNYSDPMLYNTFNPRNSSSSASAFDVLNMNQFH